MEIRPRGAWRDCSGHHYLHDSGALPAHLALCRGCGGATMIRSLKFAQLALVVAVFVVAAFSANHVAGQQANDAPGRGTGVADTLESIQKARVVTRVVFIVAHPDDEA